MKQVLQHLRTGQLELADVPCPVVRPGHLLIRTTRSLISAGTERMLVDFSRANLLAKARSQPERVKQVLDKIKADGLLPTLEAVFTRLDEPLPLGYCNAGVVLEVGPGVTGFAPGDRVASNGRHAEVVSVPVNLCARIPDEVSDEQAAFTVLSSIALQGVRLIGPTLGETIVVTGLGLIGLSAVQLLRASGCRVIGIDVDPARAALAESFGAETIDLSGGLDPVGAAMALSRQRGVDGVLIAASAKSDEIVRQAAHMCRKHGRIVLVGVVGLHLNRADFYEKEITFQVSCSYGPGRYDSAYEDRGQDYPLGFVRWTEQRNFEAVLDMLATDRLEVESLVSHRFAQADAAGAYQVLTDDRNALGIVLTYPDQQVSRDTVLAVPRREPTDRPAAGGVTVGVIGAGQFARGVGLPSLARTSARLAWIADLDNVAARHAARKFGFENTTTDYTQLLADPDVNTVLCYTPHHLHARFVVETLKAGKHVFVEKPLAIDQEGLEQVRQAAADHPDLHVMVGFNRRFAPHAAKVRQLVSARSQPVALHMMVNAGAIPADHWTQDPAIGGGRIIGEGCHFIDLLMFIVGHPIVSVQAAMFGPQAGPLRQDKMSIVMTYADGSIGTVHYWANGPKAYPKERLEVFSEGRILAIENWRRLSAYQWPGVPRMKMRQDKGHKAEMAEFIARVAAGGESPIGFDQLDLVTQASFAAVRSAAEGVTLSLSQHRQP
ncbi:MAG TPA: bi-domain-containing oxidoreductase [Phycisphaerae bacterium]|nr:bi-domain-containing oxidoreductase [Phycisphaerae bacterium]